VFVMSDVVGSTALWEAHGDAMREALEVHDRLVHGAVESAGGRVFKHTGDGMIAVFDEVDDAAPGALGAVEALAGAQWGVTGALDVRVSVHAGAASDRDGDFFGPAVNKVARINGVGHGGQVLVSDVARQLMSDPAGVDLGVHQLRDLSEPVRLWQLDDGVHPALRTLKAARHNLPVMSTEFIGRQVEVDELRSLLNHHRLVTITGVGGCGKTRLAVEVAAAMADRFPGGVWFADMTTERDGDQVGGRAIAALGLVHTPGQAGGPVDVLDEATAGAATLLIVDNCEHLIEDVADFAAEVLTAASSVSVLATSRESLSVEGEWVWRIPNLREAAVELFVDRAAAAGVVGLEDHLDRIEEICGQLDDIPLAIELAAARVSSLSIDELAGRLDDRFSLLGGGRGRRRQRQQTLQAMMDWSYGLLDEDEQGVLNQLAVFSGSFPLAGAESVATTAESPVLDVLGSLVEQSLVVPSVVSGRYRLLETVRLYALDRLLNTDQLVVTRDRHLVWMVALSGRERWLSTGAGETWELEEQKLADVANAFAAMDWAEQSGQHEALLSLYIGGQSYWPSTGGLGVSWLDRIPEPAASEPGLRSEWLATSGLIRILVGDDSKGYEQMFAAAAIVDELIETGRKVDLAIVSLVFRGIFLANSDFSAALAEADRLSDLQIEGESRYPEWMSLMVRTNALMFEGDDAALDSATQMVVLGRSISRTADDNGVPFLAQLLSLADRFDEALPAAMQVLDSQVVGQTPRMNLLVPTVRSLAGLGRYDDALEIVEKDFGPMIDAQRQRLQIGQIVALVLILHQLQRLERINDIAAVAKALSHDLLLGDYEARMYLADIIGGDDAFAALPTPDPTELTPDRIATLINGLIAEIRYTIVQGAPGR
jgi:predicted ATPase